MAGTYLQHKDFFVIAGCLQNLTQKTDVYYIFLYQTVTKHALLLVQILLLPIETNVSSSSVVGTVCQIAAFFFCFQWTLLPCHWRAAVQIWEAARDIVRLGKLGTLH